LVNYQQLLLTYDYNKETPTASDLFIPREAHVTFEGYKIDDGTLDEPAYGDQSVSTRVIKDRAITVDKIDNDAVSWVKLSEEVKNAINIGIIQESVGTEQLKNGAVTLDKLAQNVLDDGWLSE
jgi:hypothetical protein